MRNKLIATALCLLLLAGCGKTDIAQTYSQSDDDTRLRTYYEMEDGTWKCDDVTYAFRLELTGRLPNAAADSRYVVLTDREDLTFEEVAKSLFGSLLEDSEVMKGSVIVEME